MAKNRRMWGSFISLIFILLQLLFAYLLVHSVHFWWHGQGRNSGTNSMDQWPYLCGMVQSKAHFGLISHHWFAIFLLWNFNDEWSGWIIFGWWWGGWGWIVVDFASCKSSSMASSMVSSMASSMASLLLLTYCHFEWIGFMAQIMNEAMKWKRCYPGYLPCFSVERDKNLILGGFISWLPFKKRSHMSNFANTHGYFENQHVKNTTSVKKCWHILLMTKICAVILYVHTKFNTSILLVCGFLHKIQYLFLLFLQDQHRSNWALAPPTLDFEQW